MKEYMFGRTPMVDALKRTREAIKGNVNGNKILIIISDGESTDGSPL